MNKKWLTGCCLGCFGTILLVVLGIVGLGWWGYSTVTEASNVVAQEIFNNKLPPNYSGIVGWSFKDEPKPFKFVFMQNAQSKRKFLVGFDFEISEQEMALLLKEDIDLLQDTIEARIVESNPSKAKSLYLKDLETAELNGQKVYFLSSVFEKELDYVPLFMLVAPKPDNHIAVLMTTVPRSITSDSAADFTPVFEYSKSMLLEVVDGSGFLPALAKKSSDSPVDPKSDENINEASDNTEATESVD